MLTAFARAFRTPDLRTKMLFTLGMIAIFRLGSVVPTPGIDVQAVNACVEQVGNTGVYGMLNLFSGGALLQLAVFALGIMPYITASIILQLLTVVIPRLEALKKEGQAGQAQDHAVHPVPHDGAGGAAVDGHHRAGAFRTVDPRAAPTKSCPTTRCRHHHVIAVMTAGTGIIMWLGELITDRGIGNGMSLLIFTQSLLGSPDSSTGICASQGRGRSCVVLVVGIAVVAFVVLMEQGQRRIPVQYAKRMVGRRQYGGSSTYIPIKVNQAGIIPVIFASSMLYLPVLFVTISNNTGAVNTWVQANLVNGSGAWYAGLFFALTVFFTYFYVAITFNAKDVADNMKKYGGFIPGIRAGRPTSEYLDYVLTRLTAVGSVYLGHRRLSRSWCSPGWAGTELPLRWDVHSHHGGRGARYREADREPAAAAQLRRVLALVRLLIVGPPGAGKGTQAAVLADKLGIPHIATGDIFRANVADSTPLGARRSRTWTPVSLYLIQ